MAGMGVKCVSGLRLFYDERDRDAADVVGRTCERTVHLIHKYWGLDTPEDCRVYVMTSWVRFIFLSAPWYWWPIVVITIPLWGLRVSKLWQLAGGWQQRWGKRRAVGVKSPRLLEVGRESATEGIFVGESDIRDTLQRITCHELVHAFTAHLGLPPWLNEGIAMLTVDRYFGRPTVGSQTLHALRGASQGAVSGGRERVRTAGTDWMLYHYVRAYWLTRYLEETHPGLLRELLVGPEDQGTFEHRIASACGMDPDEFWQGIDGILVSHFEPARKAI